MTPVLRLEAAIEKLERLRTGAFPGPWEVLTSRIERGDHWYVMSEREAILYVSANDGLDEDYRRPTAELVVILHRTIDAQLAILRAAVAADEQNVRHVKGMDEVQVTRADEDVIDGEVIEDKPTDPADPAYVAPEADR